MSNIDESSKFFIPKISTQQDIFLKKHPKYDGRGLLIAIIDSCVDVSLPGLQKTTTGIPKILDCFDFTGNGDVDTSTVREADLENNFLIGLSDRRLKIPPKWINPSGKWHLGIKSIYELFDDIALEKVIEIRRENISKQNKLLEKNLHQTMLNKNEENSKFMLEYLKSAEDLSKDSLVADCIVWNDGKIWRACIDISFIGNLENVKILANYRDEHEFDLIFDKFAYCVSINDDGNLLKIFVSYKEHGSLVANVAAAHFPNEPDKDGLAPGAQIVSMGVLHSHSNGSIFEQIVLKAVSHGIYKRHF
uniref:Peptidase S8/S53 domain-containing protein n=1 Tax=Panagrolaimus sp. ES5 TaxID=591445 RepID=A0AC34GAM1_9BILA